MGPDFVPSGALNLLRSKVQYTGPEFSWCGLGKLFWGKLIYVCGGERLVAGLPLSFFTESIEKGADFTKINELFTSMTRGGIVEAGGCWAYLRAGHGIVLPPGYMIMEINRGRMSTNEDDEDADVAEAAVDALASRLPG